jgi:hypothetical protein
MSPQWAQYISFMSPEYGQDRGSAAATNDDRRQTSILIPLVAAGLSLTVDGCQLPEGCELSVQCSAFDDASHGYEAAGV